MIRSLSLIVLVIASWWASPLVAAPLEFTGLPAELLDADFYPGFHGIFDHSDTVHNVGSIRMHMTNFGIIGSLPGSPSVFQDAPSCVWPSTSETEYLWGAGLWVGALKAGEPRVSTGLAPPGIVWEFRPGRTELDRIYETREFAPAGARRPSPNADDDRDGRTDEDWLDGRDNDGDGLVDEDFAAISNQMFFLEMNDTDANIARVFPEHEPLGLKIVQSSMVWEDDLVDDFVAFDYVLVNEGLEPLEQVYIGFFADCDIGERGRGMRTQDDLAGFWEGLQEARLGNDFKRLRISMGYMFDDDGDDETANGYIGLLFLGAQDPANTLSGANVRLANFRMFAGSAPYQSGGDPSTDEEKYEVLNGTAPQSLPAPAEGFRAPQLARQPRDYRMVISAGPIQSLSPGDTLKFQAALVMGQGFEGLLANAVQAQLTYDGVYLDCDADPTTGVGGHETPICPPEHAGETHRLNPCDTSCDGVPPGDERCWGTVRSDACVWVNADCQQERETGISTGVEGRECLVNWLISTAPPPPSMRLVASENKVEVYWDNFSETTPDLRLNVIDFESYRIWRADNWTRPLGTTVSTGPEQDLWMLLAEFDQPNNGIGSETGLAPVAYRPGVSDESIEFYREWFRAHPFVKPPVLPSLSGDEADTAQAMARGTRYYLYVDPPFRTGGALGSPCPSFGPCPAIPTARGPRNARCNSNGYCQETLPPPHSGANYFYSVTATDHRLEFGGNRRPLPVGAGLAGDPNSSFVFVNPPTQSLPRRLYGDAPDHIYVVPNPATRASLADWALDPNNDDPSGLKVEFHHLPQSRGRVTIWTLAGDRVDEVFFDARHRGGSVAWDLVSRNGQEVTSGVYLFTVEAEDPGFKTFTGRFVIVR